MKEWDILVNTRKSPDTHKCYLHVNLTHFAVFIHLSNLEPCRSKSDVDTFLCGEETGG
jgi:hypothetical protein